MRSGFGLAGCLRWWRRAGEVVPDRGALASRPGVGAACRALAQRMSSDRHTVTRPPATGCTIASCPAEYARRNVFIDGHAFEYSGGIADEGGAGLIECEKRVLHSGLTP